MRKKNPKNWACLQSEKGFTLLEMIVAMGLLPLLIFSVFSVLEMAGVIFRTTDVYAQINHNAMQTLRHISREIGQTSPLVVPNHILVATDANGNSVVQFQIPVDWDNDGDAVTTGLNPAAEWGAYDDVGQDQSGNLDYWTEYRMVNDQLIRRLLDQSLAPVSNSDRIIANDVQGFLVTQSGDILTMSITLTATDAVGQGGMARQLTATFASNTALRNAVN